MTPTTPGMVRLLASVASGSELGLAMRLGADIVDLKDPAQGALGAWPVAAVRAAVASMDGRCTVQRHDR